MEDYQERFSSLLCRANPLSKHQQTQLFTVELQEPLRTDVELQAPQSLEQAMSFARAYEWQLQLTTARQHPVVAGQQVARANAETQQSGSTGVPSGTTNTTTATRGNFVFCYLSAAEMEERRRLGLCYNCDEKFSRNHNCKQLCCLLWDNEVQDDDEVLVATDMELEISVHTLTGVRAKDSMQLTALVIRLWFNPQFYLRGSC